MHIGIDSQEDYKLEKSKDILKKFADIDKEIKLVKSNKDLYYRNKISLKVENYKWGYYNNSTHEFVEVNNCLLANNSINDIIHKKDFLNIKDGSITIRCNYNNEILIDIKSDEKVTFNNVPSNLIGIVVNDKTIYGENYFYDIIGDMKFKISYNSFFQINNYIASEIFKLLKVNLSGEKLLDLYCGVGTLGLSVKDNFKRIVGIEKIENAILNAKGNALNNGVCNTEFYAGDTAKILSELNYDFDTVIVDPPRSGLNKETIDLILDINPNTICYVSCDQITLSRDLKILSDNYYISKINVLDMFPNTYHIETLCILKAIDIK
jgi:23S rRNA (uracil1939-C5)-methyltransferase